MTEGCFWDKGEKMKKKKKEEEEEEEEDEVLCLPDVSLALLTHYTVE